MSLQTYLEKWKHHRPQSRGLEILKYLGPGFLVTVGFIDPGNWASNVAAGSSFGYALLWMVTLSTIMLVVLQHNVAHLGIATGLCLSEAASKYLPRWFGKPVLVSAVIAAISTMLAEILGAAIGLQMLFGIPLRIGAVLAVAFVCWMLFSKSYQRLEKLIITFVSLIGLSFLVELHLVEVPWGQAAVGWVVPWGTQSALPIIMCVLGAVVMPHNLFLHSEIIQSRQWNLEDETIIKKQLNYEFFDTLLAMIVGWAINSAMIILAAATFFTHHIQVGELQQAQQLLTPLLGKAAAYIFALALLFAGLSSSVTAGMAGGSIFAGISGEPYDIKDSHTRLGIGVTLAGALIAIFFISNPFNGLIISQILLSIQLPWTIFTQLFLTASPKVMGRYANSRLLNITLWTIAIIVTVLNLLLLRSVLHG